MGISKKYQKDYSKAKFDNPRIMKKKEDRQRRFRRVSVGLVLFLIIGVLYSIFYSPFFSIKNIEINGLNKINSGNFERIVNDYRSDRQWFILSKNNFWIFDKKELAAQIEKFYAFEDLKIKKKLPNRVIVDVVEKQSAINWLIGDFCYHLDTTGIAIEYCENGDGLITIRDVVVSAVSIGEEAVEAGELDYILQLDSQAKNILKDQYKPLFYERNLNELIVKTENGPEIRFNSNLEAGEQVARLDLLLKDQEVKDNYQSLGYIDLRFGEKVFYK